jgi:hypothetical protein
LINEGEKALKILLFSLLSYDTRGNHAGTPSHWKDEEILENRAIFRTIRTPAELVIKPVKVRHLFTSLFSSLSTFIAVL